MLPTCRALGGKRDRRRPERGWPLSLFWEHSTVGAGRNIPGQGGDCFRFSGSTDNLKYRGRCRFCCGRHRFPWTIQRWPLAQILLDNLWPPSLPLPCLFALQTGILEGHELSHWVTGSWDWSGDANTSTFRHLLPFALSPTLNTTTHRTTNFAATHRIRDLWPFSLPALFWVIFPSSHLFPVRTRTLRTRNLRTRPLRPRPLRPRNLDAVDGPRTNLHSAPTSDGHPSTLGTAAVLSLCPIPTSHRTAATRAPPFSPKPPPRIGKLCHQLWRLRPRPQPCGSSLYNNPPRSTSPQDSTAILDQ